MGVASGLIGAAGGLGGFLVPVWLGGLKDLTGSYRPGLWLFAGVALIAGVSAVFAHARQGAASAGARH
jgi:NNP family nitrate/nitrite transporter-like MFS transporter